MKDTETRITELAPPQSEYAERILKVLLHTDNGVPPSVEEIVELLCDLHFFVNKLDLKEPLRRYANDGTVHREIQ